MSWAKFEKMQTCLEIRDCFNFCWFLRVFGWWQCDQWPLKTNLEMELTILGLNCYCCYCMSRSNCFTKTCANDWTNMFNRHLTKCVGKLKVKFVDHFFYVQTNKPNLAKLRLVSSNFPSIWTFAVLKSSYIAWHCDTFWCLVFGEYARNLTHWSNR